VNTYLGPGFILWYELSNEKGTMRFGTWNIRSLHRVGSLTTAARELARNQLDLVGAQEVRWDKGGTVRARDYKFFSMEKEKIINGELDFLYTTE
jgi:hypothetical protein